MMILDLERRDEPLVVLCLGAHADDLEIGCGGTILKLASGGRPLAVTWVVWSAEGTRQQEARDSAELFPSQVGKHWFDEDLFFALLRLRGMECAAPAKYAEGFYCRKAVLAC